MALRDLAAFFTSARVTLFRGSVAEGQVAGINAIMAAWDKWAAKSDPRFVAYSLATTFHETAQSMLPVEEDGRGRGRAYGCPAGPWRQIYYGRGDVQLTWEANYSRATVKLRGCGILAADQDLERTPNLACNPHIAAPILIFGMLEGWFTGKKLADFFNERGSDWLEARRIINGLDCAGMIAGYGEHFFAALNEGGWS
jgi:putative chitinase